MHLTKEQWEPFHCHQEWKQSILLVTLPQASQVHMSNKAENLLPVLNHEIIHENVTHCTSLYVIFQMTVLDYARIL